MDDLRCRTESGFRDTIVEGIETFPLDQVANAFRAARVCHSPMSAELGADILAGDESALERGQELRAGIAWLTAQLETMLGDDFGDSRCDIDPLAITEALGLLPMAEAIEVAEEACDRKRRLFRDAS